MLATSRVAAANILSQAEFFIVFVKIQPVLLFAVFETTPAVITQVTISLSEATLRLRPSIYQSGFLSAWNYYLLKVIKYLNRQNYPKMGRLIDKITCFF